MKRELIKEAIQAIQEISSTATQAIMTILDQLVGSSDPLESTAPEEEEKPKDKPKAKPKAKGKRGSKKKKKEEEPKAASNADHDPDFDDTFSGDEDPDLEGDGDHDPDFDDLHDDGDADLDGGEFTGDDLDADLELGDEDDEGYGDEPPAGLPAAFHGMWEKADAEERAALIATISGGVGEDDQEEEKPKPKPKAGKRSRKKKEEPKAEEKQDKPANGKEAAKRAGMTKKDFFIITMMEGGATVDELVECWEKLSGEGEESRRAFKNYVKFAGNGRLIKVKGVEHVFTLEESEGIYAAAEDQGDAEAVIVSIYNSLEEKGTVAKVVAVLEEVIPSD